MNVTVMVYQRKHEGLLRWQTLGLGRHSLSKAGKNPTKLRETTTEELRRRIKAADPGDLLAFSAPRSITLERVHLELSLQTREGREKASGLFPIILVRVPVNAEDRMTIAYHPLKQGEWFPVKDDETLARQATRFFQTQWTEIAKEEIEELHSNGKDSLRLLSFTGHPKDALDRVPHADVWDDLELPEGRRSHRHRLADLAVNLTSLAVDATLPLGMPRPQLRDRLQLLLGGARPQSVLLVGPSGSGKSTIIRQWIADLVETDEYPIHRNPDLLRDVWQISGKRIIAGMSYVGDWEQRCLDLLEDLRSTKRRKQFLYADDIHAWGRIGRARDSDANLALFFQSAVARGELTIVAECTQEQLLRLEEDASAFASLFTVLRVPATDRAETLRMLIRDGRELERRHKVRIAFGTFAAAFDQSRGLLTGRAMPGTALDLQRDLARHASTTRLDPEAATAKVDPALLTALLTKRTGLPDALLRPEAPLDANDVEKTLMTQVAGQPEAVRAAADLVVRIRTRLTDPGRPYAVYLFAGPTGTGKTELSRALATYLYGDESRLLRIDSSEYATADAASRLVGDSFQTEGVLTGAIRAQPFSVVLFDEVEKAHPQVLNLLLQVFDEGRLTDAAGQVADFTHAVVIMTSNLGATARAPIGLGEGSTNRSRLDSDRAIKDFFSPELFNRIDRIVHFSPLGMYAAASIVEKELGKLLARRGLTGRNVFVNVDSEVKEIVVREAFDARYGARPLKRYLEDNIGTRLAEHLASGPNAALQLVQIYGQGGRLRLDAHALMPAAGRYSHFLLEGLLDAPVDALREKLPDLVSRLDAVEESSEVRELGGRIERHLAAHNRGAIGHADRVHDLELLRERIRETRARLSDFAEAPQETARELMEFDQFGYDEIPTRSWGSRTLPAERVRRFSRGAVQAPQLHDARERLLELFADVAFLERAVRLVDDSSQHAVLVDIAQVGHGRSEKRFASGGSWLVQWLASAYTELFSGLSAAAWRWPDGRIADAPRSGDEAPSHVVLRFVGLCVRDFFEGEAGSHAWQSLGRLPEVVRVQILSPDRLPRAQIETFERARQEFEAARTRGDVPLPEDPSKPPPVVRTYRWEPPLRARETTTFEIEDYLLSYTDRLPARAFSAALVKPWLLRRSRVTR